MDRPLDSTHIRVSKSLHQDSLVSPRSQPTCGRLSITDTPTPASFTFTSRVMSDGPVASPGLSALPAQEEPAPLPSGSSQECMLTSDTLMTRVGPSARTETCARKNELLTKLVEKE